MQDASTRLLARFPISLVLSACISGPRSDPAAAAGNRTGDVVYQQACGDCHAAGEANAPMLGRIRNEERKRVEEIEKRK